AIFALGTWPWMGQIVHTLKWPRQAWAWVLVLWQGAEVSGQMGSWLIGFNPQFAQMKRLTWPVAVHLLWQFPLELPIENLLLLGLIAAAWRFLRPHSRYEALSAAFLGALAFASWHMFTWNSWVVVPLTLGVLPWTIYLVMTGDMIVPIIAHILFDMEGTLSIVLPAHIMATGSIFLLVMAALSLGVIWHQGRMPRQWV
ncbi:MAG: hypothetical protein OWS74_00780, partial [Firmicutes bacterium]|nr:hypothetical protein [Bacillota bacterium]